MASVWSELKRRNVVKVGAAYAIGESTAEPTRPTPMPEQISFRELESVAQVPRATTLDSAILALGENVTNNRWRVIVLAINSSAFAQNSGSGRGCWSLLQHDDRGNNQNNTTWYVE